MANIIRLGGGTAGRRGLPGFTYTGTWEWRDYTTNQPVEQSSENAALALLSSGILTFEKTCNAHVFLVGGGSGGAAGRWPGMSAPALSGGGGATAAFGAETSGGKPANLLTGGSGGSGGGVGGENAQYGTAHEAGAGGLDGADGGDGHTAYVSQIGAGQGHTTAAFWYGYPYAAGGGGGGRGNSVGGEGDRPGGAGGSPDAGSGGTNGAGTDAAANTGAGGGGGFGGAGGGGGAGGTTLLFPVLVSAGVSHPVTVGAGGVGGAGYTQSGKIAYEGGSGGSGIVLIRRLDSPVDLHVVSADNPPENPDPNTLYLIRAEDGDDA